MVHRRRKDWDDLASSTRERYIRGGMTREGYESGEPLPYYEEINSQRRALRIPKSEKLAQDRRSRRRVVKLPGDTWPNRA